MAASRTLRVLIMGGLLASSGLIQAQESELVDLHERFFMGYQYHVSSRAEMSGSLSLQPTKEKVASDLTVLGSSAIEYDEKVLSIVGEGIVPRTGRIYRRLEFDRTIGNRPQRMTLRPQVGRMVFLRQQQKKAPFSPDGPLTWNEIDLLRTDVFTPALAGLLPAREVRVGGHWTAATAAVQELTDLERIEEGKVECRLQQITTVEKTRCARIEFSGTVRGINEDGPNKQKLEGYYFFDLESKYISYLYLNGISFLLDKEAKPVGKIEGRFVLTRQVRHGLADLSDEAWRGVVTEPSEENTLLLYDNPDLGFRFLYPRRWHIAGVHGQQVALDEAKGSGLLITLDIPERSPNGLQFLAEVRNWLTEQKAHVFRIDDQPRRVPNAFATLEEFTVDAELGGKRVLLAYYVSQQVQGGATIAARLLPSEEAELRSGLARIATSLQLIRKPLADPKK